MGLEATPASTRRAPRRRPGAPRSLVIASTAVLLFLLLWQAAPPLGLVNGNYTSQPTLIFLAAVEVFRGDQLGHHTWISFSEFFLGFALAFAVSIPLGLLLGVSRTARYLLDPPLMALYIAPSLILLPIMIIWLGIGIASKIAVVFLGVIFPIIVNTMAGMHEADANLVRAARSFGAGPVDIFLRILIPGALPSILLGIRLGVGRGVLGVVVGELYVSQAGLGYQMTTYGSSMRIDRLLVYVLIISFFGYALTSFVRWLEGRVRNWKPA